MTQAWRSARAVLAGLALLGLAGTPALAGAPPTPPPAACIFCKIVAGTAPSRKVFEDPYVLAFWDIRPRAKVHLLVIPKQHVASLKELDELPVETRAALLSACVKAARDQGILDQGFRVITNAGKDAGQSVFHLHFHVVGGEPLREDAISKDPAPR